MTDNKNTISRRSFIKAAGVGSLGLALTTPNNASAISSSVNKENRDYIATKKSKKIIYNGYVITM
ncbi:TPA: twin-arginine translocation signal domain-containing protein, partial [Serratia marcescens]|nr:twin-arginine translocation signal domain-containing protein [Serratia marcescens]